MTTIYLVRHGESVGNVTRRFTGMIDMPLTEKGRLQADRTANYLKDVEFDVVYSSDLSRAYDTCKAIVGEKCPIIKNERLREINAGVWEGLPYEDIAANYPTEYDTWRKNIGKAHPTGGESVMELYDRINDELDIIAKREQDKTVLIALHATPIRCIVCRIMGEDAGNMQNIDWVPNASVTVIEYDDGQYCLKTVGYADHLGELETTLPQKFPTAKQ